MIKLYPAVKEQAYSDTEDHNGSILPEHLAGTKEKWGWPYFIAFKVLEETAAG